jgi:hypothetical protein
VDLNGSGVDRTADFFFNLFRSFELDIMRKFHDHLQFNWKVLSSGNEIVLSGRTLSHIVSITWLEQ